MKIIITGVSLNSTNMGIGALAVGLINCLKKNAPDIDIHILDYGRKKEVFNCITDYGNLAVPLINIRFSRFFFQTNNIAFLLCLSLLTRIVPFKKFKNVIVNSNKTLRNICDADIVGTIAGGDSFSDIYGYSQFLYVSLPQILVILLKKKLVQLPQTFGPYKNIFIKSIAKYILNNSFYIISRDYEGVENVKQLLKAKDNDKISFSYDVGFALNPISPSPEIDFHKSKRDNQSLLIGLNISGLLYTKGYINNMFSLKIDYPLFIEKCLEWIIEKNGMTAILIPHVYHGRESDFTVSKLVYKNNYQKFGKKLQIIETEYDHHQIKYCIGQVDFFIGSRMHACIAALSQCIPVVGIAYSPKFIGVFSSIEMSDMVIDVTYEQSIETILNKVTLLYQKRDDITSQLKIQNARVCDYIQKQFQEIIV
ncbi:MAG: polysaccharide pyruvyl transferase family protein [Bacteroidales bacterium]|nr:polysaccharide pyruvyl transferase family protein [Bacteroidales bacterium]